MKANILEAVGKLEYKEIPLPDIRKDEVLVNVKACGICGSDVDRVFKTGTYHFPTVIGHEFSGLVAKAEGDNKKWEGKRVGVYPLKPCFKCSSCKEGHYEMCLNYDYLGSRCNGGFEEFVAVPVWNLIELPDNVTFEEAAMLEPISVAIHALDKAGDIKGRTVAIIGPGPIGNLMAQIAKIKGAKKVIMIGRSEDKLRFSQKIGILETINSRQENAIDKAMGITDGVGADITIEGTGASQSLKLGIEITRRGGNIILMGNPLSDMELSRGAYWQILRRQLTLNGTWNSSFGTEGDDWHQAVSYLSLGLLDAKSIITHTLEFNELLKGLEIMKDPNVFSQKVMLVNNN